MYTRVESRFWVDEKMRAISDDARYLMLYLLTSPHRNILGFYYLPAPYACFDLGWDEKRFRKGLEELLRNGCIMYDPDAHIILIKNYLKHNPLDNPNQVKSAIEKLDEIPQTPLFLDFLTVLERLSKPFMEPLLERLRERLPKPGTGTGTVTGSEYILYTCASTDDDARIDDLPNHENEHESAGQDPDEGVEAEKVTATSGEQLRVLNKPRPPFTSKKQENMFDEFWAKYPKKKSKGQAEKAWVKLRPDEELFACIMDRLDIACRSPDWTKDGGQYIPYPATWLNAKGWEDEYDVPGDTDTGNSTIKPFKPGKIDRSAVIEEDEYQWFFKT